MTWRRIVSVLAFAALALAPAARADYRASYQRGLEAVTRGDWQGVVRFMREAASEEPTSDRRIRVSGFGRVPYIPYYYQGLGHYRTGECEAALALFEKSIVEGVIYKTDQWSELQRQRDECRNRLAEERKRRREPEAVEGGSGRELTEADGPREPTGTEGEGISEETPEKVDDPLEEASPDLEDRRAPPPSMPQPRAPSRVSEPAKKAAEPDRGRSRTVPQGLRTAAEAYFTGDYAGALEALEQDEPHDDLWAVSQACLLRSAALYALYRRGGEEDGGQLRAARTAAAGCRRLAPDLVPDGELFSPGFVAFFTGEADGEPE